MSPVNAEYSHILAGLPVTDPVLVFAIILLIILVSPVILRKIRVPGIIGLIVSGIIIGPSGFNIIEKNQAIDLFSTIGLLFLMFIAGLDLDQLQFRRTRHKSLLFGFLTYTIPFSAGLPVCYYLLGYNLITSLMISNMFATHTMVSYPIVSKLGLTRNEAVAVATGGTVITDTVVLLVLAVISGSVTGAGGYILYVRLVLSFIAFLLFIVYLILPLSRWAFRRLEDDNYSQFIFTAFIVFICAVLAMAAGLEPIIGAFAAGFVLNRLIPADSILRDRIDFTGNALFIPFFLISVGMIVDLRIVFSSPMTIIIAVVLTAVAMAGKYLAADITSRILRFTRDQRFLLFGLTSSHAAAILAVIMVGFRIGIVDEVIINGTVFLIMMTCLISSVVTESSGRKIALSGAEQNGRYDIKEQETIIVSLSNPDNIERLVKLAFVLKKKNTGNPIYALSVVVDDDSAGKGLISAKAVLERAAALAIPAGRNLEPLITYDSNPSDGIKRIAREREATDIIIGVPGRPTLADLVFGRSVEQLIENSNQNVYLFNPSVPNNLFTKVHVFIPPNIEKEKGSGILFEKIIDLADATAAHVGFYCFPGSSFSIGKHLKRNNRQESIKSSHFAHERDLPDIKPLIGRDDLLVILSPRRGSLSYSPAYDSWCKRVIREARGNGYLIIHPA
jgi:Kef-type K+ transport system membrane component KefB/nucleotide-binding universal stress UspA family protein